jgi:DNA polymerase III delta prime subunit
MSSEEEKQLNQKFEEFKANFASFGASFPNVDDFQKKMMIKGQIVSQTSDFLSAIIYFSMALWSYALSGKKTDQPSISTLQNLIIQNRQKLKSSLASANSDKEDTPLYAPEKESDMINKITKLPLDFETLAGAISEKEMIKSKFVYPLLYPFLYLTEDNNVLLYGPPGTGKTLLAKACVGELNKDASKMKFLFYNLSADSIRSKWEGGTEKNIATIFKTASDEAMKQQTQLRASSGRTSEVFVKSIIFLDEVEALAKSREEGGDERAVTTLLQQMDGFKTAGNVMVIAATNFPWTLDSAFLRRFTARVLVDLPDFPARIELIADTLFSKFLKSSEEKSRLLSLKIMPGLDSEQKFMSNFSKKFEAYDFVLTDSPIDKYIKLFLDSLYEKVGGNVLEFPSSPSYVQKYACYLAKKIIELSGNKETWIWKKKDSQKAQDLQTLAKFVFFFAELTGPNSSAVLKENEENKPIITNRRTTNLGMSKYGHSPSDITKIISEFFSITARQIISACYEPAEDKEVCNLAGGFQVPNTQNCFKALLAKQLVTLPCNPPAMSFSSIQSPPSKTKKFMFDKQDIYAVFIPDLLYQALLTYRTTTGNSDYYCNLIEYSRTTDPHPTLSESCKKIPKPSMDF